MSLVAPATVAIIIGSACTVLGCVSMLVSALYQHVV